ncbi:MAG: sugar phosphate isomerase/epimerase family protein [Acidimicrobiales bacterium]
MANAPVSWGVFELTTDLEPFVGPDDLLAAVAGAGYEGVDLGPAGYLGRGEELGRRLAGHGLGLAGGWIEMRFSDRDGFEADLAGLSEALDLFEAATAGGAGGKAGVGKAGAGPGGRWWPKPTLADAGSAGRKANPGRGAEMAELGLSDRQWAELADRVELAAGRVRARGFEPTFHHHAGTYVEAPQEIERLLDLTDVGLCLDSGHILLGGGDPMAALSDWGERINHLHVKDCRLEVLRQCLAEGAGMAEVWSRGVFCGLGAGDLDLDGFLGQVLAGGYQGWLVVEQDVIPGPGIVPAAVAAEQARNRAVLRGHGV